MVEQMNTDIVVIGGGVVGLAFACAVADQGFNVVIVEGKSLALQTLPIEYQLRVSAINKASQRLFTELGVWQNIVEQRVSPYQTMHVWDDTAAIDFSCTDIGVAELGYIIENQVIQQALLQRALKHKNIQLLAPAKPENIEYCDHSVMIKLVDQSTIEARLLIAADGANSWVRQQCHIPLTSWHYDQQAFVTTVVTEQSHQYTAWQRFLPTGPLAFLPLNNPNNCSIVWSVDNKKANELATLNIIDFNQQLNAAFEDTLGNVTLQQQPVSFALQMRQAKQYVKNRVVLIGDAAHTIHPLAGQGMNLGLKDASYLADLLEKVNSNQRDIGSLYCLHRYQRVRRTDAWRMIMVMESFKRLFASHSPMLKQLRRSGLRMTNKSNLLKSQFIRIAMGLNNTLSRV